jgi:SAM-dependent methyltransferase
VPNIERWKFAPFVGDSDVVLDFGCGDGRILAGLQCRKRYGVEANGIARAEAASVINVYADIDEIPSDILFDVIISHHALEHVDHPLHQLERIRARLKPKGKAVLVVPSELWLKQRAYRSGDINQHLYTWTPLSLGNLFTRAGFVVERVELLRHRLLPKTSAIYRMMPKRLFHLCCNAWGMLTRTRQIRIVATKGSESDS